MNPRLFGDKDAAILQQICDLENIRVDEVLDIMYDIAEDRYVIKVVGGRYFKVDSSVIAFMQDNKRRDRVIDRSKDYYRWMDKGTIDSAPPKSPVATHDFVVDLAKTFSHFAKSPPRINRKPTQEQVLIVGLNQEDSFDLAHLLGFTNAVHVTHYSDMMKYPGLSVYITERGRERTDFGAIEGLFIRGNHSVIDIME